MRGPVARCTHVHMTAARVAGSFRLTFKFPCCARTNFHAVPDWQMGRGLPNSDSTRLRPRAPLALLYGHMIIRLSQGGKVYLEAGGDHVGAHDDTGQFQGLAPVAPADVNSGSLYRRLLFEPASVWLQQHMLANLPCA